MKNIIDLKDHTVKRFNSLRYRKGISQHDETKLKHYKHVLFMFTKNGTDSTFTYNTDEMNGLDNAFSFSLKPTHFYKIVTPDEQSD